MFSLGSIKYLVSQLKHLQANLAVHWAVLYKISGFKMIENWWHQNGV
jgi:hypothetical protein